MSNRACVVRTKMIDYDGESLGVRVYDEYEKDYCNLFETIPDDDGELLAMCTEFEVGGDIIRDAVTMETGLYIDDVFYNHKELVDLIG